jgi:hypothetical protein
MMLHVVPVNSDGRLMAEDSYISILYHIRNYYIKKKSIYTREILFFFYFLRVRNADIRLVDYINC